MENEKKKKLIKWGIAVLVIVIILNIPIVSDVIAMTRIGMIESVISVEKVKCDGEKHNLFVFDKLQGKEEYGETVAYVVENNILRAKIRIWEPCTGLTGYAVKPTFGTIYQESSKHFEIGTEPRENGSGEEQR